MRRCHISRKEALAQFSWVPSHAHVAYADLLRQATDGLGSVAHSALALQRFRPCLQHLPGRWEGATANLLAEGCIHADGAAPPAHRMQACEVMHVPIAQVSRGQRSPLVERCVHADVAAPPARKQAGEVRHVPIAQVSKEQRSLAALMVMVRPHLHTEYFREAMHTPIANIFRERNYVLAERCIHADSAARPAHRMQACEVMHDPIAQVSKEQRSLLVERCSHADGAAPLAHRMRACGLMHIPTAEVYGERSDILQSAISMLLSRPSCT